jgi:Protein of unknown function (DUF2849)
MEHKMKVLTANRLSDGIAVWYSTGKGWDVNFATAELVSDAAGEARLAAIGAEAYARNEVIDVNVVDAEFADGKPAATKLRERIRAEGPTIDYHGKAA